MGVFSRLGRGGHLPPAPEPLSVDDVIANAEHAAAYDPKQRDDGPGEASVLVAHGKGILVLRDLIAVELLPGLGKVGLLFMTDATKSTRNQQFRQARVVSFGPKAKHVMASDIVMVSEYFGQEVRLRQGTDERVLRVGRERDITGITDGEQMFAIGDRVLLERIDAPKMAGLLHLPEDRNEQQFECCVVSHGRDCKSVKTGNRVLVKKGTFVIVRYDGFEHLLIDEPAILAIL